MRSKRKNDDGFDFWGGYMEAKKKKLQEQFAERASKETTQGDIFKGVSIFVNGFTVPSADELKQIMMLHGGTYHYYERSKTTHIIASNLPDCKVKQLRKNNVVKPSWIVDSLEAKKLLDYKQYLLYPGHSSAQRTLNFGPTTSCRDVSTSARVETNAWDTGITGEKIMQTENLKSRELTSKEQESFRQTTRTAKDEGFLYEFYSHSRLHHISTMGTTFKDHISSLREKSVGQFPGRARLREWKLLHLGASNYDLDGGSVGTAVIMHIDMDCFFVSVGLRNRPELKGLPVAVTHSKGNPTRSHGSRKRELELYSKHAELETDWIQDIDETDSMAEIASCSYEARKAGVKNGMFLGPALKLCPNLRTITYDFEAYTEVSYTLYHTVAEYTLDIEAVSCDEMLVDCSSVLRDTGASPLEFATLLRQDIKERTGCPSSAGFGANRLQARLATRKAKPNGQFYLRPDEVFAFMAEVKTDDLPGVGYSISRRLATLGVKTCAQLRTIPLAKLSSRLGPRTGKTLYDHCRGRDDRPLEFHHQRRSVSADVNYGIRMTTQGEAEKFLKRLSEEVARRLADANVCGRCITLKLLVRAKDAPEETAKFMGCGVCDSVTRSTSLAVAVRDADVIAREVIKLERHAGVPPSDLRGVGITISRLESKTKTKTERAIDSFMVKKNGASTSSAVCTSVADVASTSMASVNVASTKLPSVPLANVSATSSVTAAVCPDLTDAISAGVTSVTVTPVSVATASPRIVASVIATPRTPVTASGAVDSAARSTTLPTATVAPATVVSTVTTATSSKCTSSTPSTTMALGFSTPPPSCSALVPAASLHTASTSAAFTSVASTSGAAYSCELSTSVGCASPTRRGVMYSDLPSECELDKDVLAALPDDIRREILDEYRRARPVPDNAQLTGEEEVGSSKLAGAAEVSLSQLSFSQIQPSFLDALPSDIVKDLQNDLHHRKKATSTAVPQTKQSAEPGETLAGTSEPASQNGTDSARKPEEELLLGLTLPAVREMLKEWVKTEETPQLCDVTMITDYMCQLVVNRQLHRLDMVTKCLYRCITQKKSCVWQDAFHAITSRFQDFMKIEFGGTLKVCDNFECEDGCGRIISIQ